MLDFKSVKKVEIKPPVPFDSIEIGETFVRYSEYKEYGLDEDSVWFFIKFSDFGAVKLNPESCVNKVINFEPEVEVLAIQLKVSEISVK